MSTGSAWEYEQSRDLLRPHLDAAVMLLGLNGDELRIACWQDVLVLAVRDGARYGAFDPFAKWVATMRRLLTSAEWAEARASGAPARTEPYGLRGVAHRQLRSAALSKIERTWPPPTGCFSHEVMLLHARAIGSLRRATEAKGLDELKALAADDAAGGGA